MTLQETVTERAKQALAQLVSQVIARVPTARANTSDNLVVGVPTVCASFLKSAQSETVDLCVNIRTTAGTVTISADLVQGGNGEVFSEMTAVTFASDQDAEVALRGLEVYVRNQAETIVRELR